MHYKKHSGQNGQKSVVEGRKTQEKSEVGSKKSEERSEVGSRKSEVYRSPTTDYKPQTSDQRLPTSDIIHKTIDYKRRRGSEMNREILAESGSLTKGSRPPQYRVVPPRQTMQDISGY